MANQENNGFFNVEGYLAATKSKATVVQEAIINRLAYVIAVKGCDVPEIRETAKNFLARLPEEQLRDGADVILRKELSVSGAKYATDTDRLCMVWEKNSKPKARHPYILWVHVKASRKKKSLLEKAQEFFVKRIPGITEEVVQKLFEAAFDGDSMVVCPYTTIEPVVVKANDRPGGHFLLQEVDRDGNIAVNWPYAYVVGNRAYLYIPGNDPERKGKPWLFKA